jgi:hypothetical protein
MTKKNVVLVEQIKKESKFSVLDFNWSIVSAVVGAIISTAYQILFKDLCWALLILYISVLFALLINHISEIKSEKRQSQKRIMGWVLLGLLVLSNTTLFIPSTNQILQSLYFPTSTSIDNKNSGQIFTPTITPTIAPSLKEAQLPNNVISVPTLNPFNWYDFKEDCIPAIKEDDPRTAIWAIFPKVLIMDQQNCLPLEQISGFIPHDKSVDIFIKGQNQPFYKGLELDIPNDAESLSFTLEFTTLEIDNQALTCRFFYGFDEANYEDKLSGELILYEDSLGDSPIVYFRATDPTQLYSDKMSSKIKRPAELRENIIIDLQKSGYMTVQINRNIPSDLKDIPIKSRRFVLGYNTPAFCTIDLKINDFKINSKISD